MSTNDEQQWDWIHNLQFLLLMVSSWATSCLNLILYNVLSVVLQEFCHLNVQWLNIIVVIHICWWILLIVEFGHDVLVWVSKEHSWVIVAIYMDQPLDQKHKLERVNQHTRTEFVIQRFIVIHQTDKDVLLHQRSYIWRRTESLCKRETWRAPTLVNDDDRGLLLTLRLFQAFFEKFPVEFVIKITINWKSVR